MGEYRAWRSGLAVGLVSCSMLAMAQSEKPVVVDGVFEYEERSTIDTIPFRAVEEEALANTVIEGGLTAPAAGVPVKPATEDDFYLDPLALEPRDRRTDLGRSEVPVEFQFANPKSIPGGTHTTGFQLRLPQNRTIESQNINMMER
ncbi:hypothetical protein LPB19_02855 [Marinobacter salinisoli]|uniref:Uncharacterized protein n=2 Tax=Marinobacter salinisoli TaxID=2769486 RepID=A0ABX7MYN1_9GAMM|nr:hypothetical protein LPB19_02855 [Marinobacter salinisoli]